MLTIKTKKALCLSILVFLTGLSSASATDNHRLPMAVALLLACPLFTPLPHYASASPEQRSVQIAESRRKKLVDHATYEESQTLRHHYTKELMSKDQAWHEDTHPCCLATKKCLAKRADMRWHNNCTLGYDWPIWMATVVGIPVSGCTATACSYGYPVTAAGILCCGLGIPCALKIFELRQEKPENVRSTLDWLSSSSAWEERVATHAPRPMTMHLD